MAPKKPAAKPAGKNLPAKVAEPQLPATLSEKMAAHAGAGLERATMRDYALPFLYLLQKGSPEVDENDDKHVPGAKQGMFMNTVTKELFESLKVVPCDFQKVFNEWVPRNDGGGFVKSWNSQVEADAGVTEGNQIVETANHYVLVQAADGTWSVAVLSLTSTKLKASRNWLSRISQRMIDTPKGRKTAPSFGFIYEVEPVSDSNEHGTFYVCQVKPVEGDAGVVDEELFDQAVDLRSQLTQGLLRVEFSKDPTQQEGAGKGDQAY